MHKTNSPFWDKHDIKSFEHTTFLTSALHNVYQSKQNHVFVYLRNYSYLTEYSQYSPCIFFLISIEIRRKGLKFCIIELLIYWIVRIESVLRRTSYLQPKIRSNSCLQFKKFVHVRSQMEVSCENQLWSFYRSHPVFVITYRLEFYVFRSCRWAGEFEQLAAWDCRTVDVSTGMCSAC